MPLPKGTISLQNPNAANAGMQASTKVAMLVRLPAEAYAALEHATDIEVVNDGPTPGIKIAEKFYALHHAPETHPHELILQARTPNKSNPPLKTHAQIVHKMVPPPARSDASSAYARAAAAAAAEAPRKSTAMIESVVPVVPINGPAAKVAPKKVGAGGAAKRKPGSAAGNAAARQRASGSGSGGGAFVLGGKDERLSASTSRATARPSTPSLSTTNANTATNKPATSSRASPMPPPPAPMPRSRLATSTAPEPTSAEKGEIVLAKMAPSEREALRMRMVHEVAKGARRPRSREDLRQSLSGIDWHAFKSLLSEVAEPSPPIRTAPDKETTWALRPRVWRDVRPYAAPPDVLSAKEANLVAEYADAVFDKQGLPHDHPAREAVRPRQPNSSSYPSSALASGSPYAGRSPSYAATSGGVPVSKPPGLGTGLPPKPPGLPPKPIGAPLPPINSSRQRMSPMPPPKVDSRAGSVAGTPRGRREADAGRDSEREEGEMDEDEPARPPSTTNTSSANSTTKSKAGAGKDKEPETKRRKLDPEQRAKERTNASPPPPSPSVLKKSGKRAREEEPDAVPRRAGREREREEAPPKKKAQSVKREPSPLPPPPSQAGKKKVTTRDISPPPAKKRISTSPELSRKPREREKEREREETPSTTARRKRGREVDFTSDEDSDEMPRRISSASTKGKARESDRERESEREQGVGIREVGARKIAPIPRKAVASGSATPTTVRPLKEKERVGVKERSTPVHSKEGSIKPVVKHDDRDRERERERPAKHDDHPRVRETERERERDKDRPVQTKPKPKPQAPKREPSLDLSNSSSSRSSSPLPSKSRFMPSDLGPLPSTADGLRARMRTAYKYYYQAHAACEEQKEVILAALAQGEGDREEGQERRGPRLCSEKTVMEMYGVYEAWRDEVLRVKSAAEGLGGGKEEEGA